jgi:hypothetical protein
MPQVSSQSSIKSSPSEHPSFSFTFSFKDLRGSEFWRFAKAFGKLVLVPSLLALAFVELLAWRTGATISSSVRDVAELQHEDPNILWAGAGQLYGPLALARIQIEHPDIIMVGHSGCGQMRSMMFKPYTFHNACVVAWSFEQIKNMIDLATRGGGPKIVMFTLDYFMLGDKYAKKWEEKAVMDFSSHSDRVHFDGLIAMAESFNRRPLAMVEAMPNYLFGRSHDPVDGLEQFSPRAIAGDDGSFRSDGSLLYDQATRLAAAVRRKDIAVVLGSVPERDGEHAGEAQMKALEEIGELGRERNVTLVALQLPKIQEALDVLDSGKDWHDYPAADRETWKLLESPAMQQRLQTMGINFFDLSHDPIAKEPRAFIDPAHPSEYATAAAIYDAMTENPAFRAIFPRLDSTALSVAMADARQQDRFFDVYGAEF